MKKKTCQQQDLFEMERWRDSKASAGAGWSQNNPKDPGDRKRFVWVWPNNKEPGQCGVLLHLHPHNWLIHKDSSTFMNTSDTDILCTCHRIQNVEKLQVWFCTYPVACICERSSAYFGCSAHHSISLSKNLSRKSTLKQITVHFKWFKQMLF